jgi:general secretion pathway protein A
MTYFKLLGLETDPFFTSPAPAFFYESKEHHAALTKLMIEIRLKRGLSVILGDVGTGKTTLSRKLSQMVKARGDMDFHMILDPLCQSEEIFLGSLIRAFNLPLHPQRSGILEYKEALKNHLFRRGVEQGKTIVLLIDEGQKLTPAALEILRLLLNFETTSFKLLQVVISAQNELLPSLMGIRNLWDRISFKCVLHPLDEFSTRKMIEFRVSQAGYKHTRPLFTDEAMAEIFRHTRGYPRRICMLCHEALKFIVMEEKLTVDEGIIRNLIATESMALI